MQCMERNNVSLELVMIITIVLRRNYDSIVTIGKKITFRNPECVIMSFIFSGDLERETTYQCWITLQSDKE